MNLPISQITQFVLSFRILLHNFHGSEAQIHVKILDNKPSLSKKNATLVVNTKAFAMTGSYLSWSFLTCSDKIGLRWRCGKSMKARRTQSIMERKWYQKQFVCEFENIIKYPFDTEFCNFTMVYEGAAESLVSLEAAR